MQTLVNAIENRRLVEFTYDAELRVVEPHALFEYSGTLLVMGFQRTGGSKSGRLVGWKTFEVERIESLRVLPAGFFPRTDYHLEGFGRVYKVIADVRSANRESNPDQRPLGG